MQKQCHQVIYKAVQVILVGCVYNCINALAEVAAIFSVESDFIKFVIKVVVQLQNICEDGHRWWLQIRSAITQASSDGTTCSEIFICMQITNTEQMAPGSACFATSRPRTTRSLKKLGRRTSSRAVYIRVIQQLNSEHRKQVWEFGPNSGP